MKNLIAIILFMSSVSHGFSQSIIYCDSLDTSIDTLFLTNFEDSVNFSYNYSASNAGVSGGIYVSQSVTLDDTSVIDTINILPQGGILETYVYPTQNYLFDIDYSASSIPTNYTVNGNYLIYYDGLNACQIPFTIVFNQSNVGIGHLINDDKKIRFYPNPSSNNIIIENNGENILILKIYNSIGIQIQSKILFENKIDIDISSFNIGLYLFEISDKNGRILYIEKIVKN